MSRRYSLAHFSSFTNSFDGLNAGTSRSGTITVVFLEMLRAVFALRCLTRKVSEASQADIHLAALRLAHLLHKFFHNGRNRYGLDTRFTGNLLYYFRFRHIRTSFVRNSILLPRLSTIQYDNIGSMTGLLTKKTGLYSI